MSDERFRAAVAAFDAANALDPNRLLLDGESRPRELVDAERLSRWVERLWPEAPVALCLAARCQHIKRWEIARSAYPPDRAGYLQWRTALGRFHATESGRILAQVGYGADVIDEVRRINVKQGLRSDPLVQTMEDALCLSFLEHELDEFATRHDTEKVIAIIQKTWNKMSPGGHEHALALSMSPAARGLVERALAPRKGSGTLGPG